MRDSKYLVSIFPGRQCDHQCHNGNPDEEHMQLLSLNKISQFPLHCGTMGPLPGRWLSSYFPRAIIKAQPLPPTTLIHFTALCSSSFSSPHPSPSRAEAWQVKSYHLEPKFSALLISIFTILVQPHSLPSHQTKSKKERVTLFYYFVGWLLGSVGQSKLVWSIFSHWIKAKKVIRTCKQLWNFCFESSLVICKSIPNYWQYHRHKTLFSKIKYKIIILLLLPFQVMSIINRNTVEIICHWWEQLFLQPG